MPGAPLSLPEREEIGIALIEDGSVPWVVIGRRIGRHPTTVMREVTANGGRTRYRPAVAEGRSAKERCRSRRHRLALAGQLRDRVTAELKLGRSPVAIWADLVADDVTERACTETIDQGSEWSCWETIASSYDIDVWFCDPHAPPLSGQFAMA